MYYNIDDDECLLPFPRVLYCLIIIYTQPITADIINNTLLFITGSTYLPRDNSYNDGEYHIVIMLAAGFVTIRFLLSVA